MALYKSCFVSSILLSLLVICSARADLVYNPKPDHNTSEDQPANSPKIDDNKPTDQTDHQGVHPIPQLPRGTPEYYPKPKIMIPKPIYKTPMYNHPYLMHTRPYHTPMPIYKKPLIKKPVYSSTPLYSSPPPDALIPSSPPPSSPPPPLTPPPPSDHESTISTTPSHPPLTNQSPTYGPRPPYNPRDYTSAPVYETPIKGLILGN